MKNIKKIFETPRQKAPAARARDCREGGGVGVLKQGVKQKSEIQES